MRLLVAMVLVLAAASTASAKRRREFPFEPGDVPVEPCGKGKTWPVVKKCLDKTGTVAILHQTDKTRTVSLTPKGSVDGSGKRVLLYAQTDAGWVRTSMTLFPTKANELLRVDAFPTPKGDAVRVDMGSSARTSFTLAPSTGVVRGVLRRTFTTICVPDTWGCSTLMTSCESYVRGKVYWAFHGEVVWHPSLGLRLRGSRKAAAGLCKPADSIMIDPEDS